METSAALSVSAPRNRPNGLAWPSSVVPMLLVVICLAVIAAVSVVGAADMRFEAAGFLRFVALAAALCGLHMWCVRRELDPRVGDAALIVALGTLALMTCGIISNAGLRLGATPIDAFLAGSDVLFGIDVETAVRSFARYPWLVEALSAIYNASGALVVAIIMGAVALGARRAAWELVATVVISMQIVALLSVAFPAIGAMAHFQMLDLQGNGLPEGAGTYHLEAFERFHAGSGTTLRLSDMSGLVTFPSFHTVLALLSTQALAGTRLRWLGLAWTTAVIVSTIPIGGHYVTDLVAGFAIWAGCAWTARRFNTPSA